MPTVAELTAPYGNLLLAPRRGPEVCRICFNLTDGYGICYACAHGGRRLDAVGPISYSVAGEQLHHVLAAYKRRPDAAGRRFGVELAAVLWRHLAGHERCLAQAAGVEAFTLVTTVPSGARERDGAHPLHAIAGELVDPLRDRYVRALARSAASAPAHEFRAERFECRAEVSGHAVLLVDDMWTTGANAQSAAAALKAAGAIRVAAVVIGRHLHRDWRHNDRTLRSLPQPFDWSRCGLCAPGDGCRSPPPGAEHSPPVLPGDLHDLV